jgi:hypothetical protein
MTHFHFTIPLLAALLTSPAPAGFLPHTLDGSAEGPAGLSTADLDGDGDRDVAGACWGEGEVCIWWNDGSWTREAVDADMAGATFVSCSDIDGDGLTDLAATAWDREVIRCYLADGAGGWTVCEVAESMPAAHEVHPADIDGDGDQDLITAVAGLDRISWWESGGGAVPSWTEHVVSDSAGGARSVVAADVDGDGDDDLVGTAFSDGGLLWWESDGGAPPSWTEHTVSGELPGAHMVRAGDLDGDGDTDLATAAYYCAETAVWINLGGSPPAWEKHVLDDSFGHALAVCIAELDGQGGLDVAATSEFRDRVKWWWNDGGSPSGWPGEIVDDDIDGAWPLAAGDLDGDGRADLTAGGNFTTVVRWYENQVQTGFAPEGASVSGLRVSPNPASGPVTAEAKAGGKAMVYDCGGRLVSVLSEQGGSGRAGYIWRPDRSSCPAGVYVICVRADASIESARVVLLP